MNPWMVVGDFNIIRNDEERKGGRPRHVVAMVDYNSFIEDSGLVEMNHTGTSLHDVMDSMVSQEVGLDWIEF